MRRHYLHTTTPITSGESLYPPQLSQRQKRRRRRRGCLSTKRYGTVSPSRYRGNVGKGKERDQCPWQTCRSGSSKGRIIRTGSNCPVRHSNSFKLPDSSTTVDISRITPVRRALSFFERSLVPVNDPLLGPSRTSLDPSIEERPQQKARIVSLNGSYVCCRKMIRSVFLMWNNLLLLVYELLPIKEFSEFFSPFKDNSSNSIFYVILFSSEYRCHIYLTISIINYVPNDKRKNIYITMLIS